MNSIGERLIYLREKTDLNREQVMKQLHISNLGRYESDIRVPTIETLAILANFYGVSIDWIATGKETFGFAERKELKDYERQVAESQFQNLTEEQVALINTYEKLTKLEKDELWLLMDHFIDRKQFDTKASASGL